MSMQRTFLAELQRRNVPRAAVLYAGAVWALAQGIAQLGPFFGTPGWVVRWFVIAGVIGFPFWISLAWYYRITPHGIQRDSGVMPDDSVARTTGRKLDYWIIGVLVVAVVLLITNQFVLHRDVTGRAQAASAKAIAAALAKVPAKSIAVLPFENLSTDQANAFFVAGIQDEILTGLARIGDLKVISRTSTAQYQSHPESVKRIAATLDVATILEGSVQKAGGQVLINVQLIDARTDNHIWAQSYTRTLDNIFGVESEVAEKIAASLQAVITRDERKALDTRPTDNPDAYTVYLKGRALLTQSMFKPTIVEQRIAAYQQAVTLDPRFALAWADLVRAEVWMYWEGFDPTPARLATAKAALQRAVALAPDTPQVELARGWYQYYGASNFRVALAAFHGARKGLPNDERAWAGAGAVERRLGDFAAAAADFRHALMLNPNSVTLHIDLGQTLIAQRQFMQARAAVNAGLESKPGDPVLLDLAWYVAWSTADPDAATTMLQGQHSAGGMVLAIRAAQALYLHRYAAAASLYARAIASNSKFMTPSSFGGYIPAAVDWQLHRALSEDRRGAHAHARAIYHGVKIRMLAALAKRPGNVHVQAALRMALGEALAGLGERDAAAADGRTATALIPESNDAWEGTRWLRHLARIYATNGAADKAVPLIAHLLQTQSSRPLTVAILRADPVWDPIRKDPRFQALLAKYAKFKPAITYGATTTTPLH